MKKIKIFMYLFAVLTIVGCSMLGFKSTEQSPTTASGGAESNVVTFKLEYNGEDQVYIAGSFNDWQATSTPMKHEGDYWIKRMNLDTGKYQYKFVINGTEWKMDPNNPNTADDGYGAKNSVITVGEKKMAKIDKSQEPASPRKADEKTIPTKFSYQPLTGGKKKVYLAGDFNDWNETSTPLTENNGIYEITLNLNQGKYKYKFIVDGKWVTDENADELVGDGFGGQNSVVIVGDISEIEALHRVKFHYKPKNEITDIYLAGAFNDWNQKATQMQKTDDNHYAVSLLLKKGRYSYKFIINGSDWIADMSAAQFEEDGFGGQNSIIEVDDRFPEVVLEKSDGMITTSGIPTSQSLQTINPITETKVEFKAKVYSGDVEKVFLNKNGELIEMDFSGNDPTFDYFHKIIELQSADEQFDYYFVLQDGSKKYYILDGTISDKFDEKNVFHYSSELIKPFSTPEWVKNGIIYQIFCDRFYNGDKSNDQDFSEWYYEGVNEPPEKGKYLPGNKQYFHLVEDWYDHSGLKNNPHRADDKPDWWSFYGGDIMGIKKKLPYLEDLGITIIYFNPLFEAKSNHKYDAVDYMKIDPHFGTTEEFKEFVKDAHSRGIRIIIDCAFNHTGETFFAFQDCVKNGKDAQYWHWYEWKKWPLPDPPPSNFKPIDYYDCWWGVGEMPNLNFDKSMGNTSENGIKDVEEADPNWDVVNYVLDVGEYWIKDMDIDGFRLDVPNEVPFWFWKLFNERIKSLKPDAYLVGEIWGNATDWVDPEIFDAVMNYAFFKDPVMRFFAMQSCNANVFDKDIKQGLFTYPVQVSQVMMNLIDSHDTHRFLETVKGDLAKLRLTALFEMTYVGTPHIWYGDEIGMMGAHDPDCRRPFNWKFDQDEEKVNLRNYYKKLIHIRKKYSCLRTGSFKTLLTDGMVYSYLRQDKQDAIVVVLNNSTKSRQIEIDTGLKNKFVENLLTGKKYSLNYGKLKMELPAMSGGILK